MIPPAPAEHGPRDQSGQGAATLRLLDRPVLAQDLAACAARVAEPVETRAGATLGLLLFHLGGEVLAISARLLRCVSPYARTIPIPHKTSPILRGLCTIRGELVLCADLGRLLGLPERAGSSGDPRPAEDQRRMVMVGTAGAPWAFEVDRLVGVERIDASSMGPPPVTVRYSAADCTLGLAKVGGGSVTVLDGERILSGFQAGLA